MPPLFLLCLLFLAQGFLAQAEHRNETIYAALGDQAGFILHNITLKCNQTGGKCNGYQWWKDNRRKVANVRGYTRTGRCVYSHRCNVYENGSLQLSNISAEDSGYYFVEVYDVNGTRIAIFGFLLKVQDPVSKPMVNYSCLENGTIQLSCIVQNGTDPEYYWTIEGMPPPGNCTYSQNDTCTISLKSSAMMREVICTVKNQISEISHSINVSCPETSTSALAPTLTSTELHIHNSTEEGKALDNKTVSSKNTNTSWTECQNSCIMQSAIWGSVVLLVTGLALILGCLCTMPKE